MCNKMQTDNHNLRKNAKTNEKQIFKKKRFKFHKLALYMYFVLKCVPLSS